VRIDDTISRPRSLERLSELGAAPCASSFYIFEAAGYAAPILSRVGGKAVAMLPVPSKVLQAPQSRFFVLSPLPS
jgi:hypothetical protein